VQIIPFVQSLLDAHFIPLLLLRQSHPLLRRLSKRISAHTELVSDLSSLAGALSIYSRKKDELKRSEEKRREEKVREEREKKMQQVEGGGKEAVKSFGEKMERRIRAQEKHAEVGMYQVDEFYL
jgi:DNA mismatch repair ATPase MutS